MRHNILLFLCFTFLNVTSLYAQNLFDEENTRKYADYLFQRGNYQLAIPEYERLIYFNSQHETYKIKLLDSYFRTSAFEEIERAVGDWYPNTVDYPASFFYLKTQLKTSKFQYAQQLLSENSRFQFPVDEKPAYLIVSYGLANAWGKAAEICETNESANRSQSFQQYCQVVASANGFKPKNKFVAAGLSTLVPGLGRVYTKDYADAVVNILFIGVTAFQAIRGFRNEEINDLQGWIYGGVALSFYMGNIYGSWRAADQFNYRFYESKRQALDRAFFGSQHMEQR
jgi:hypothetical protein